MTAWTLVMIVSSDFWELGSSPIYFFINFLAKPSGFASPGNCTGRHHSKTSLTSSLQSPWSSRTAASSSTCASGFKSWLSSTVSSHFSASSESSAPSKKPRLMSLPRVIHFQQSFERFDRVEPNLSLFFSLIGPSFEELFNFQARAFPSLLLRLMQAWNLIHGPLAWGFSFHFLKRYIRMMFPIADVK